MATTKNVSENFCVCLCVCVCVCVFVYLDFFPHMLEVNSVSDFSVLFPLHFVVANCNHISKRTCISQDRPKEHPRHAPSLPRGESCTSASRQSHQSSRDDQGQ